MGVQIRHSMIRPLKLKLTEATRSTEPRRSGDRRNIAPKLLTPPRPSLLTTSTPTTHHTSVTHHSSLQTSTLPIAFRVVPHMITNPRCEFLPREVTLSNGPLGPEIEILNFFPLLVSLAHWRPPEHLILSEMNSSVSPPSRT